MEAKTSRNLASLVLGAGLVVLGALLFVGQVTGVDTLALLWPLFIIVPGTMFFVVAEAGGRRRSGFVFPGAIVTTTGLLLLYQSLTGHWESWAYAWALIAPASVGIALMMHGAMQGRPETTQAGIITTGVGLVIFLVGAAFFEFVLNISGRFSGATAGIGGAALLIAAGLVVIALGALRPRRRTPAP